MQHKHLKMCLWSKVEEEEEGKQVTKHSHNPNLNLNLAMIIQVYFMSKTHFGFPSIHIIFIRDQTIFRNEWGELTATSYKWNRLSLRNHWLKISIQPLIVLEESMEYVSN